MKLSEVIRRYRDLVKDHGGTSWSDYEATRYVNQAMMYVFRAHVESDESYHNLEVDLSSDDATELHSNVWVYRLPRWVYRITRIRVTKTSSQNVGQDVFPGNLLTNQSGWYFDSAKTLRLVGYTEAQDLTVSVCKIPARLHQGTTPADAANSAQLYSMDHPTPGDSQYEMEDEPDAYANALFELTGIADAARDPVGQLRICTGSGRSLRTGSTYYTSLTLSEVWTESPDTDDTYEMHPEVDDAHMRFVVLLAARYSFMANHNKGALEATQIDFADERRRFLDSRTPRDDGLPHFWGTETDWEVGQDPDRDWLLGRYDGQ